jgi:hypothetical protein
MRGFYRHNVQLARAKTKARKEAVSKLYKPQSPEWYAELLTRRLQDVAEKGLPDCYDGIGKGGPNDYLYDFWADVPYDSTRNECLQTILKDPRMNFIKRSILWLFDFNIEEELQLGMDKEDITQ